MDIVKVPRIVKEWREHCKVLVQPVMYFLGKVEVAIPAEYILALDWVGLNEEIAVSAWVNGCDAEPTIHELKIEPNYFKAVEKGNKKFEIRLDDRDYRIGDKVLLKEWRASQYTGNEYATKITYITNYNQKDGFLVFGIE